MPRSRHNRVNCRSKNTRASGSARVDDIQKSPARARFTGRRSSSKDSQGRRTASTRAQRETSATARLIEGQQGDGRVHVRAQARTRIVPPCSRAQFLFLRKLITDKAETPTVEGATVD